MELPFVSVIIPSYNSSKTLSYAVKGALNQNYPSDKFEIIVVDDGSTDNTGRLVEHFNVKYIYKENGGPAEARNLGAEKGGGDIVAFLDSDCIPRKNWLMKMVNGYTDNLIVCVGSRYGIANKESFLACCIYFEFLIRYRRMPRHPKFLGSHGYSFKKDIFYELGGYNTEYKMASHEDNDLAYRISRSGYLSFFDKSNIVEHFFPESLLKYLRVQFWHGYWRMKLYRDHPKLVTGDDYSDIWDYMQPPFMLLFLILLPLSIIDKKFLIVALIFLLMAAVLTVPISISMVKLCGRKRYFAYIPLAVVRSMARGIGMLMGIIDFWVLKRKTLKK